MHASVETIEGPEICRVAREDIPTTARACNWLVPPLAPDGRSDYSDCGSPVKSVLRGLFRNSQNRLGITSESD